MLVSGLEEPVGAGVEIQENSCGPKADCFTGTVTELGSVGSFKVGTGCSQF